ncbi:MAG TPA: hypothetical protein QKA08_01680 [Candidatus Megaira endosymbiont of Nemacystus decipiens]|nr:hypothetical protein [Candidatus Megaera endosymbiont of Nemacystus decipiens]
MAKNSNSSNFKAARDYIQNKFNDTQTKIQNASKELSKTIKATSEDLFDELNKTANYVKDTTLYKDLKKGCEKAISLETEILSYQLDRANKELTEAYGTFSTKLDKLEKTVNEKGSAAAVTIEEKLHDIRDKADETIDKAWGKAADVLGTDKEELKRKAKKTVTTAYKLATAPATFRVLGVISTLTLATPFIVVSATAAGIGFAIDAVNTDSMRKNKREYNALLKYRDAKNAQDILKGTKPKIFEALDGEIKDFTKGEGEPVRQRKIKTGPQGFLANFSEAVLKQGQTIFNAGTKLLTAPNIVGAVMFVKHVTTTNKVYENQQRFSDFKNDMKKYMNNENAKDDSVGYKDVQDLEEKTRAMRVQAMALKETIKEVEKNNQEVSQGHIKKIFEQKKSYIEYTEKEIKNRRGIIANAKSAVKTVRKSIDPLSKYADIKHLEKKSKKGVELQKKAEKLKDQLNQSPPIPPKPDAKTKAREAQVKKPLPPIPTKIKEQVAPVPTDTNTSTNTKNKTQHTKTPTVTGRSR